MNTLPKGLMRRNPFLTALLLMLLFGTLHTQKLFAQDPDNCSIAPLLCNTDAFPSETTVGKSESAAKGKFVSSTCGAGVQGQQIRHGAFYHFKGYQGGKVTINITSINSVGNPPIMYAEIFMNDCTMPADGGTRAALTPNRCGSFALGTGGSINFTNVDVVAGKDYWVVLGYTSVPGVGQGHTYSITLNNDAGTPEAVIGAPIPRFGAAQCFTCTKDRKIAFTNFSTEHSDGDVEYKLAYSLTRGSGFTNPKFFTVYPNGSIGNFTLYPGPLNPNGKDAASPDTIIDVIDLVSSGTGLSPGKPQHDIDSMCFKIKATNGCQSSKPPYEYTFYVQKNDPRYDTLPFSKCDIKTIPYFIQFPYRPSLTQKNSAFCAPPGRDSLNVLGYSVRLQRPAICGLPDEIFKVNYGSTPGHFLALPQGRFNSQYSDQFNVNVYPECYGLYTTVVKVLGGCFKDASDSTFAYDSKGYDIGYDPLNPAPLRLTKTQDTAAQSVHGNTNPAFPQIIHKTVFIPPPPKVNFKVSSDRNLRLDPVTGFYLKDDGYRTDSTFCSYADSSYIRFERTTRRGRNGPGPNDFTQIASGDGQLDWNYNLRPINYKQYSNPMVVGTNLRPASDYTTNSLDDSVWVLKGLPGFADTKVRYFYFELRTTDQTGFCSIDTFRIILKPLPEVRIIKDSVTICGSGTVKFKSQIVSGVPGAYSFFWDAWDKKLLPDPPFPSPPTDDSIQTKTLDAAVDTSMKMFTLWIQDQQGCNSLQSPLGGPPSDTARARVWTNPYPRIELDSTLAFCVGPHQNTRHLKVTVLNLDSAARKLNAAKSDFNYYWFLPSISPADPDVTLSNNPNKAKDTITVFKLSQTSTQVFIDVTTKSAYNKGACTTRDTVRWVKVKRPVLIVSDTMLCERDKFGRTTTTLKIDSIGKVIGSYVRRWPSYPNYGFETKCFAENIADTITRSYDFKYHNTGVSCQPGVYNYRIAVADPIHCDVDTIINQKLTVSPAPKFKFTYSEGGPVVCKGQRIVINASGADVNSYVWSIGQYRDYSDTLNLFVDYPDVSKTYIDTVTGSLQGFCTLDTTVSLTVLNQDRAPKLANAANDFTHNCEKTSRTFSILNYNSTLGIRYAFWFKTNGGQANCTNCSAANNIVYKPGQSSVNIDFIKAIDPVTSAFDTLFVRSLNASGCLSKDTAYIIQLNPIPVTRQLIPLNRDSENDGGVCKDEVKTYIEPTNGSTYRWALKFGYGAITPPATGDSISITWNTAGDDTLKVQEETVWNCFGDTVRLPIKINPKPIADFAFPPAYCQDSVLVLKAIPTPNPLPAGLLYNYKWTYTVGAPLLASDVDTLTYFRGDSIYIKVKSTGYGPLSLTVTASNVKEGCSGPASASHTINIERRAKIDIDKTVPRVYCQGEDINITCVLSNIAVGSTVTNPWYLDGSLSTPGANGQFSVNKDNQMIFKAGANPGDTGVYVFRYSTFSINPPYSCSPSSDTIMVHVRPAFNALMNPTGNKTLCQGEEINFINTKILNAHYGQITWSAANNTPGSTGPGSFLPSANDSTPIYKPKTGEFGTTTIKLKILNTSTLGCPSDSSNILVVNYERAPIAKIDPVPGAICASTGTLTLGTTGSIILNPTSTYVKWDILSPLSPQEQISTSGSITSPTYYIGNVTKKKRVTIQLTVLSPNCPASVSDPISFDVYPDPTAYAGDNNFITTGQYVKLCQGDTTIDLFPGNPTVGGGYTSLRWTATSLNPVGQVAATPLNNPTVLLPQKFALTPGFIGDFAIVLTAMNGVCPDVTDSIKYRVFELPQVKITPSSASICQGIPYTIAAAGVTVTPTNTPFNWTVSQVSGYPILGSFSPANAVPTTYNPDPQEFGTRLLTLTAKNGVCPTRSGSVTLTISPKPSITGIVIAPNDTICYGHEVSLKTVISNPQNFKFEWTPSNSVNDPNLQNIIATPSVTTIYKVIVTDKLGLNCQAYKEDTIVVLPRPTITSFTPSELCNGQTLTLKGSIPSLATGGVWSSQGSDSSSFTDDGKIVASTVYTPTPSDTLNGEVVVKLQALNPYCNNDLYSLVQKVKLNPTPTIDAGVDMEISQGQTVQLNGNYRNNGFAKWTTDGTGKFVPDSLARNSTYEPSDDDYVRGKIEFTYTLMLGCSPGKIDKMLVKIKNISANNGVSANNDGINDYLEFKGLPENSRLKVFDKWGRLVYETPSGSYYDNSWNGDNLPAGVYYYVLTYRLGNQHGWVEIFK